MTKIHIDEVIEKGPLSPIIVNFQNGYATDSISPTNCHIMEHRDNGTKTLITEIGGLMYAGQENQEELGQSYILARNKTTGKVRLIEVSTVEVKTIIQTENKVAEALETTDIELSRKFGSRKHKLQMEQRERLKINVEMVSEQMKTVTANTTLDKMDLTEYTKQDSEDFYVPTINRQAEKVEDVYDWNSILTEEEYDKILSEIESKDVDSEYHSLIKNVLITKNLSGKEKVLALYASTLFNLYSLMMKDITKKTFVAVKSSTTLNQIVFANFFDNIGTKRLRPQMYKDKALCHALVFTMLLNNYKIDVEDLSTHVKVTARVISTKAKVTGASVVTSGKKKVLQLKLPLASAKIINRRKSAKF